MNNIENILLNSNPKAIKSIIVKENNIIVNIPKTKIKQLSYILKLSMFNKI